MCVDPATAIASIKAATTAIGSTLGGLGTAASIGGGVISAYAQVQNAKAQAAAAQRNAQQQEEAARQAIEQGEQESDRRRRAGAALLAENTAALAANNIDVSGAQALDLLDDTQFMVEEDAFAIRENSRRRATGHSQAAANSLTDAANANRQAFFAPVKTILTTASKVGRRYSSWVPDQQTARAF